MSLLNLADNLNRDKQSNFDDIIATAKQSEKRIYNVATGQSLFLIRRRDKKRLSLVCKNVRCDFSIVYGLTKCISMKELHSCSFSKLFKKNEKVQPMLQTTDLTPSATMDSRLSVTSCSPSNGDSRSNVNPQQSSLIHFINPPPSTADFSWSSTVDLSENSGNKTCTTKESLLQPVKTNRYEKSKVSADSMGNTIDSWTTPQEKSLLSLTLCSPPTAMDNRISSPIMSPTTTLSDNRSKADPQSSLYHFNNPPPSTADFVWSSTTVLSENSSNKACTTRESLLQPTQANGFKKVKVSCAQQHPTLEPYLADDNFQKYVDNIISIVDTDKFTAEVKFQLSNRIKDMLKCQFGFQFFRDIFNSYSAPERDNMIIQLQMQNCLKKAKDKPRLIMPNFDSLERTPSPKPRKRHLYEDDEDEDEITYRD